MTITNTIEDEVRAALSVKRADLLRLIEPPGLSPIHLQVHRNYAFELIGSVLPPFLWIARLKPIIAYGVYDDTLSFSQIDPTAVQIISLDFERYGEQGYSAEFRNWFSGRLENLRVKNQGPIIVSTWPSESSNAWRFNLELEKIADRLPSVFVWETVEIFRKMRD